MFLRCSSCFSLRMSAVVDCEWDWWELRKRLNPGGWRLASGDWTEPIEWTLVTFDVTSLSGCNSIPPGDLRPVGRWLGVVFVAGTSE